MNSHVVFMPDDNGKVQQEFPDAHHRIGDDLWAIGSDLRTCVDVCERLGIETGQNMVVVPVSEYYGRFDRALWQRLDSSSRL